MRLDGTGATGTNGTKHRRNKYHAYRSSCYNLSIPGSVGLALMHRYNEKV